MLCIFNERIESLEGRVGSVQSTVDGIAAGQHTEPTPWGMPVTNPRGDVAMPLLPSELATHGGYPQQMKRATRSNDGYR